MSAPTREAERPYFDCPRCNTPLIPADGRGRTNGDGEFVEHRDGCRCHWCGWIWWETAEPVTCACGAVVNIEVDDDYAYVCEVSP